MKKLAFLFIVTLLISCNNKVEKKEESKKTETTSEQKEVQQEINILVKDTVDNNMMLLGKITLQGFKAADFSEWFSENYNNHPLDIETIKAISPKLKDINIKVFMGTWCSDSQRETPALYKILDAAEFDYSNIEIIAVNHDKETPKHLEKNMDIQYVPTIIFYKEGKEIGRYVELAQETLEKDMLAILNETGYKHSYEE
ncbi:MAG: thioredoxin family protein [Flavobacteriaceae bacterium]